MGAYIRLYSVQEYLLQPTAAPQLVKGKIVSLAGHALSLTSRGPRCRPLLREKVPAIRVHAFLQEL